MEHLPLSPSKARVVGHPVDLRVCREVAIGARQGRRPRPSSSDSFSRLKAGGAMLSLAAAAACLLLLLSSAHRERCDSRRCQRGLCDQLTGTSRSKYVSYDMRILHAKLNLGPGQSAEEPGGGLDRREAIAMLAEQAPVVGKNLDER